MRAHSLLTNNKTIPTTLCATKQTAILEPLPGVQLLLTVDYATTANGGHTVTAAATASGVEVSAVIHLCVLQHLKGS
jgi:hypothetical protein